MSKLIYVHIDTTSNAVLSQGIAAQDFNRSIVHQPKNLLLLDPSSEFGTFESHTGMKIIRGTESVAYFFEQLNRSRVLEEIKWIDFTDLNMIKELSPLEISELLYFGHMKTHLHSPFFYKLQNNFVYFDLKDQRSRVYYRYLDEFYRILADKITHILLERMNEKRSFFKKATAVNKLDLTLLRDLRGVMQEGVVFCFDQEKTNDKYYTVPIYLVEDNVLKNRPAKLNEEYKVAALHYNILQKHWDLEVLTDDLEFNFLDKKTP